MNLILKVVTGSQLHGLAAPGSDIDFRGIFMVDLMDYLSPYRKFKNTSWIEGDVDDTSYELGNFCKMCTQGNPSALEVLWSDNIHVETEIGKELKSNRHRFLDSNRIFEAHRGYAHNQYKKMNLFEPDDRTPKFAVAYIRSLQQGIQLLETGDFSPRVIENKDFLYEVKTRFNPDKHTQQLSDLFASLQKKIIDAHAKGKQMKPDIEWIEQFIFNSYVK